MDVRHTLLTRLESLSGAFATLALGLHRRCVSVKPEPRGIYRASFRIERERRNAVRILSIDEPSPRRIRYRRQLP
jgi:hypothetical protein